MQKPKPPLPSLIISRASLPNNSTLNMLSPLQLLIQSHQHYFQKSSSDNSHDGCADIERHCEDVSRLPLALVQIRHVNARGVADCVNESESGGAFGWRAGEGVADPGVADDEGGAGGVVSICIA